MLPCPSHPTHGDEVVHLGIFVPSELSHRKSPIASLPSQVSHHNWCQKGILFVVIRPKNASTSRAEKRLVLLYIARNYDSCSRIG